MTNTIDDWDMAEKPLNLKEMDDLIAEMQESRALYEEKKAESSQAHKGYKEIESKVMLALEAAGKKSYRVDGLGSCSIVHKRVTTTAKTIEAKRELYAWIDARYGNEFLISMLSVNHATLNSFYNKEYESHLEKLQQARQEGIDTSSILFDIPLPEPTLQKSMSFRKAIK